jgi:hypothetical protein
MSWAVQEKDDRALLCVTAKSLEVKYEVGGCERTSTLQFIQFRQVVVSLMQLGRQKKLHLYVHAYSSIDNPQCCRSARCPNPDPSVFGPPGTGSISHRYGSESGSFYHQAKIVRKTLISTALWLLFYFLSLKNYVNVPSKSDKQKHWIILFWEKYLRIASKVIQSL